MKKSQKEFYHIPEVETPVLISENDMGVFLIETSSFINVVRARERYNVSGKGVTVAVLDTGLRATHVDFAGKVLAQVNFTADNGSNPHDATDGNGHGTNVSGIVAANALNTGIAPGASVIPVKVLPNKGIGDMNAVYEGLKWVFENRTIYNISVVNMSMGNSQNETSDDKFMTASYPITKVIDDLTKAGVAVVVAAGNRYFENKSVAGMSYPAILRNCISVGAVYDANGGDMKYGNGAIALSRIPGQITPFSQRLPREIAPECYTDIFAPGAPITSSGNEHDRSFSVQQGTSQSAPVIAGVICLMQELYQNIYRTVPQPNSLPPFPSIELLQTWLRQGGMPIYDGDNEPDNVLHTNVWYSCVNAYQALRQVRKFFVDNIAFDGKNEAQLSQHSISTHS